MSKVVVATRTGVVVVIRRGVVATGVARVVAVATTVAGTDTGATACDGVAAVGVVLGVNNFASAAVIGINPVTATAATRKHSTRQGRNADL